MLFPTLQFGMFFFAVFMISWGLNHLNSLKKSFLLLCSWVFYCSWDPQFLPLLIGCTLFNYGIGLGMDHLERKGPLGPLSRKGVLIAGIVLNLSTLGLFKYSGFLGSNLNTLLSGLGFTFRLPIPDLLLPLGISFFTFQGISYIVDVYSGRMKARRSPLDVMLFICFFPHLVSGPIVRASEFIPQLDAPPNPHLVDTNRALLLVFCGLFKKLVLANYLAIDLVDPVFEAPLKHGGLDSWLAFYGYAMQIYCDFSAYSDMAIGFAALLGYRFPENFNQPYRAASLQDFWRRWHISLSSWLRDYLFIPLGGSQSGRFKTYRNLFLTMFLGGIWHGAAWTFVFWGA
ncbi:MAG: MBOAT family protein, partial [Proteobacteria bacterium]|nr:MBOAT family protein [Pseudomonadota bacterium]